MRWSDREIMIHRRARAALVLAGVLTCLLGTLSLGAAAASPPAVLPGSGQALTPQETWVLDQVGAGRPANLLEYAKTHGGSQELCRLRGVFLQALITDAFPNYKVHRKGVCITHAVVTDHLDLEFASVTHDLKLMHCTFLRGINGADAVFKQNLRLDGSTFLGEVHFIKMKVAKSMYMLNTLFLQGSNLSGVAVGESFNAEGAFWESDHKSNKANFQGFKVEKSAYLSRIVCNSLLDFRLSHIGMLFDLSLSRLHQKADFDGLRVGYTAKFNRTHFAGDANFTLLKVGNYADFNHAVFAGQAALGSADIGRDLRAAGARFTSPNKFASFFRTRVGNVADFTQAVFHGPVDFGEARIGLEFQARGVQFHDTQDGLSCVGTEIGTIANLSRVRCQGPVSFAGAHIGGQLNLSDSHFNNPREADFAGITVGQLLQCTDTVFRGPVNFTSAKIGGTLRADVQESGTIVAGGIFGGKVVFQDAHVSDLLIKGRIDLTGMTDPTVAKHLTIQELNLDRMVVDRDLSLEHVQLGVLAAWNLTCKGQAAFSQVTVAQRADLRGSTFQALKLEGIAWPKGTDTMLLSGMSCKEMSPADNPTADDWRRLITWVGDSPFDTRSYLNLQAYFSRIGLEDLADETLIAMKRRELRLWWAQLCPFDSPGVRELWAYANVPQWLTFVFWDLPVGYGRKPMRIIWFALPVLLLGAYCIDPKYLTGITWPQQSRLHNVLARLLLSLDKFTPSLLDLGLEKSWHPPEVSSRLQLFLYFHRLMGRVTLAIFGLAVWAKFK